MEAENIMMVARAGRQDIFLVTNLLGEKKKVFIANTQKQWDNPGLAENSLPRFFGRLVIVLVCLALPLSLSLGPLILFLPHKPLTIPLDLMFPKYLWRNMYIFTHTRIFSPFLRINPCCQLLCFTLFVQKHQHWEKPAFWQGRSTPARADLFSQLLPGLLLLFKRHFLLDKTT